MAAINPVLTIAALSPIAISLFITTRLGPRIEAYRRASRATTGRVTGFLGELLGSVQAVQVATSEQHAIRHFDSLSDSRRSADLKEVLVESLVDSASGVTAGEPRAFRHRDSRREARCRARDVGPRRLVRLAASRAGRAAGSGRGRPVSGKVPALGLRPRLLAGPGRNRAGRGLVAP